MIYFLYGKDSYRSKLKLQEIVEGYKKVHKSGLNLIYIDIESVSFEEFYNNFRISSMFAEKKLIVLKSVWLNKEFQEDFLEQINYLEKLEDIIIIYEDSLPDQRTKFFKTLVQKSSRVKSQNFEELTFLELKKWVVNQFANNNVKIDSQAISMLLNFVGSDLWRMASEINKLSNYKKNGTINIKDVGDLVKPTIDNDIFRTIEALASKNKKLALSLIQKHLDEGDNALYVLSMIAYQFKNLLMIKDMQNNTPYNMIAKKSGLHPFVVQKTFGLCSKFTMDELKKIYWKIFQLDTDIKVGKVEAEIAIKLLVAEI